MAKGIAIMQPYFFPYIGYYQLVNAVDEFIFYDDVNYIKKGWINRNSILVNQEPYLFTVPLYRASQNKLIKDTKIHPGEYIKFKKTFLTTIEQNYKNCPYFDPAYSLVYQAMDENSSLAELAINSIKEVSAYLDLNTEFHNSSSLQPLNAGKGQERIISLCKNENASEYINLIGGKNLYDPNDFQEAEIYLKFIETDFTELKKLNPEEHFGLSIIHLLMNYSPQSLKELLEIYNLQ